MSVTLKLVDIELHNFRLFDDIKIKFDDKLTVLIGENGAGKTALLEGIVKALMFYTKNIRNNTVTNKFTSIYAPTDIRYGSPEMQTSLTLSYQNDIYKWHITQNDLKKNAVLTPLDSLNRFIDAVQVSLAEQLSIIAFYQNSRLYTNGQTPIPKPTQAKTFTALDNALEGTSLDFKTFVAWYIWQEQIEQFDKTQTNTVLDTVRTTILAVLNDDNEGLYKKIYIDPTEFNNPRLILEKGNDKVEVNQLSSGEKSLFVLVSDLARRLALANPLSKNPLSEGQGIVLIDEIDLHLHPRWQRKVMQKLVDIFPKIQWVVTTHSPLVLTHAPKGKALRLNNGEVTEYQRFRGMRLVDIFYDLYDTTSRPEDIQKEIDNLFEAIDGEDLIKAHKQLNKLKAILPENDPAILEAQTTLDLITQ